MSSNQQGRTWLRSVLITAFSLLLAFLTAAVVMVLSDPTVMAKYAYFFGRPSDALMASWEKVSSAYGALFTGAFGSFANFTHTTAEAAPLIAAGLGVALAFRAGLFNIGAQGQALMGALVGAYLGFTVKGLPLLLHLPLVLVAAILGGALWGGIVGILKARTGAHEVILTIMMNYIAAILLAYLMDQRFMQDPSRNDPIAPVLEWSATLPRLDGGRLHLGFLLALLAAFGCWWLLERTKFGLQLQAVGINPHAAATAGTSVSRVTAITMTLAGGLAGLGGVIIVTAPEVLTSYPPQLTGTIVGVLGFDAITVALLGRSRPLGVVFAALLFGALKAGRRTMESVAKTPAQLTDLIQALIVLFVAAPAFVAWLLPFLKERDTRKRRVRRAPKEVQA